MAEPEKDKFAELHLINMLPIFRFFFLRVVLSSLRSYGDNKTIKAFNSYGKDAF